MKKQYLFLSLAFIIITFALGFWFQTRKSHHTIHPKVGPVTEAIYGLGTVTSENTYTLKLGVTSSVRRLFIREGDSVTKGQSLIQFDDFQGPNQVAPFEGTIAQVNYFPGETVFPQSPVLSLIDLKHRYISVTLDQQGAMRVRSKQKAKIRFENIKNQVFEGTVRALFPKQGQIIAHINTPNLPSQILPEMTADVSIIVGEKPKTILLPIGAIQHGTIQLFKKDHFESTPVTLGIVDSEWAEILSPQLQTSDTIQWPKE